ncbi:MAG: S4 domain-containing protein [Steroidobacteraceae bacterium]
MSDRLHKVLAQHGLGSRREIERWILEGRVRVNGELAQEGAQFTPGDRVSVDGDDVTARLRAADTTQVIMYHKPQHQPVTPGAQGHDGDADDELLKQSVLERLPAKRGVRWLVINTMQSGDSGLLLLTTDGKLADALRRRAASISAAYVARVLVPSPDFDIVGFPLEVRYDEETVEFTGIDAAGGEGANRWFRVEAAHSHRRAAVRALFESRGMGVSRVSQVRFGELDLPRDLPRGKHRELTDGQRGQLYALAGLSVPRPQAEVRAAARSKPVGAKSKSKSNLKAKPVRIDRTGGRSGRRPGGNAPLRARVKPGGAKPRETTGSRKSDR